MSARTPNPLDGLISGFDQALRTLLPGSAAHPRRAYPAAEAPPVQLDERARQTAAALMRVNHAGEVCAQALYLGQGLGARTPARREALAAAAAEEEDHLHWCARRLQELEDRPSRLNVLWFGGAFSLGALAGLFGERVSMGFLEETERQVVAHLEGHLGSLPPEDEASHYIVRQMRADEARHAETARAHGAVELPKAVRTLMRMQARVMTTLAARI